MLKVGFPAPPQRGFGFPLRILPTPDLGARHSVPDSQTNVLWLRRSVPFLPSTRV